MLAEPAPGFVLGLNLSDDKIQLTKKLLVRFLRKADGDLTAVATLSADDIGRIRAQGRGEIKVVVRVADASGNEPFACDVLWAWIPRER